MKLLYITKMFPFGFGETFLAAEVNELIKQGWEVTIVPFRPPNQQTQKGLEEFTQFTVFQPMISVGVIGTSLTFLFSNLNLVLRVFRLLFQARSLGVFLKNLLLFPKAVWLADYIEKHDFEHMHVHWISTPASMALIASELTDLPWSVTAHRSDIVLNNLLQLKTEKAEFVRYISESGFRLANALRTDKESHGNSFILPVGVSLPRIDGEVQQNSQRDYHVICPANLIEVKGHKYLLKAIQELLSRGQEVTLLIAGQGELEQELKDCTKALGIAKQVRFLGHLAHQDLLEIYTKRQVDAVVLPSLDLGEGIHEGIPVALIEAMSFGVPVISTKTGGIPELVKEGCGILVPDKNAMAIADAIEQLRKDEAFAANLARSGQAYVKSVFDIQIVVKQLKIKMANGSSQ